MKNFQQDSIFKRIMHSTVGLFLFIIFILFFAWNIIKFAEKARETARNKNLAQEKIDQLQQEKARLTSDIQKLNTTQGVEEDIRNKFGLAKDGEGLVVVVDDQNTTANQNTTQNSGFWAKIMSWFK